MKQGCAERAFRLCFRKGDKRICHAKSCFCRLGFAHSKSYNFICRGIEVVITGLTRNQFVSNHTRVRIPPSAPNKKSHPCGGIFCLTQLVGENPIRVADEGSIAPRRADAACERMASVGNFERSESLPISPRFIQTLKRNLFL